MIHEVQTIPLSQIVTIGLVALILGALFRLVSLALAQVSRSSIAEAVQNGEVGMAVLRLLDNRKAGILAAQVVRVGCISVYAIAVVVTLIDFISSGWLLLGTSILTIALSFVCTALVLPSSLAIRYPVKILQISATPLWVIARFTKVFVRKLEEVVEETADTDNDERVALMVERVNENAALEEDERSLFSSVFELSRTYVREVMVPRTDMITINANHTLDQALMLFSRSGFSRVPIVGESTDDLLGVLYLKDVIRRVHRRPDQEQLPVVTVQREPYFVPETMLVDDLLQQMKATSVHIALVVDEYGGIAGLVTIEDLLEELVGEMVDEHDRAIPEVEEISTGVYRVPARLPLDELGALFGKTIEDDDVDTVAGLLSKHLGRVPIMGSEVEVAGLLLAADKFQGRRKRISTVLASVLTEEETND